MTGPDIYLYRATPTRWVDGDTVDIDLDLGFSLLWNIRVRLVGPEGRYFDAWETRGEEREKGLEAWEFAKSFAPVGIPTLVRTHRDRQGKYGRWLAQMLHPETQDDLATYMVAAGHGLWGP